VRLDPAEERGERPVQSLQGGLLGTERPTSLPGAVGVPDLFELRGLVAVADRHPAHPVRLAPFFQCPVVQLPVVLDAGGQGPRLARGGADLELVGAPHFSCSFRQGRSYWVSMYRCTVDAETAPTVATKYDRDRRVGSRDFRCGNSSRSTVNPLNWLATWTEGPIGVATELGDVVVTCPVWAVNPQLPVKTRTAPVTTVPTHTLAVVIGPPLLDISA